MEISAERLDEPKKKFWLVLSQLISRAAAATACIAWGEGTILATYWWIFRAQKVLLKTPQASTNTMNVPSYVPIFCWFATLKSCK